MMATTTGELKTMAETMKNVLGLRSSPIGVRIGVRDEIIRWIDKSFTNRLYHD
jgi:hypothetical protein